MGAPGSTPGAALQGEIGASTVKGRDMKIKITFAQYMFRTRNELLEGLFRKMIDEIRPRGWMRQLRKYMGELGISRSHLKTMSGEEVGGVVNKWEGKLWKRKVECKTTLQLFRNKVSIEDKEIYCNRLGAVILLKCRTNTLRLKWSQGFVGGAVDCPLCGAVEETVTHFVTKCVVLEGVRERFGVTLEEVLEKILFFRGRTQEKVERSIALLEEMWRRRRR